MKRPSFLAFVGPSVGLMLALMALPLAMTAYLSVHTCTPVMELATVQQSGPFGTENVLTQQVRNNAAGQPEVACRFVGLDYFRSVLGLDGGSGSKPLPSTAPATVTALKTAADAATARPANEFLTALRFTLLYTLATTPFILGIGLALALSIQRLSPAAKSVFIAVSLLPFIVTPVVGALSIKWLFRDGGLVPHLLSWFGIELYWMAQAWSAQLLILLYGIWHVAPFAFIVLYAGLQSVPQDAIEAATVDGASRWQKLRYVTLPHLMPLVVFITMIHLMDAYRVFEPVLVLTRGAFTTSVQYLTYDILLQEANPYKASAAAMLTVCGVALLLVPLLAKTWREQRAGTA